MTCQLEPDYRIPAGCLCHDHGLSQTQVALPCDATAWIVRASDSICENRKPKAENQSSAAFAPVVPLVAELDARFAHVDFPAPPRLAP